MKVKTIIITGDGVKELEDFLSDPAIKILGKQLSPAPAEGLCDTFYVFYEPVVPEEDPTVVGAQQLEAEKEELRRLIKLAKEVQAGPAYFEVFQKCKNQTQRQAYLLAFHNIGSNDAATVVQLLDPLMACVLNWEG